MKRIDLGGLGVSALGLGCMGMSEYYGPTDWDTSIATIHRALEPDIAGVARTCPLPDIKRGYLLLQ